MVYSNALQTTTTTRLQLEELQEFYVVAVYSKHKDEAFKELHTTIRTKNSSAKQQKLAIKINNYDYRYENLVDKHFGSVSEAVLKAQAYYYYIHIKKLYQI